MTRNGWRRSGWASRATWQRVWHHVLRWLPMAGISVLTYLLFPVAQGLEVRVPNLGEVAQDEVLAPFDFTVYKSAAEMQREADELTATLRPVYDYREGVADSIQAQLARFFDALDSAEVGSALLETARRFDVVLTGEEARYLLEPETLARFRSAASRMVRTYLAAGVAPSETVELESADHIVVLRNGVEETRDLAEIRTSAQYLLARDQFHPDPESSVGDQVYVKILFTFSAPTLVRNNAATEAKRENLVANIDSVKFEVKEDERIIAAHEVITADARDRLVRLQVLTQSGSGRLSARALVGQIMTNGLIVGVFWALLTLYLPDVYGDLRKLLMLTGLFAVTVLGAAANYALVHGGPELIPIPFAAITITVLLNGRIAMVAAMVLALLLGSQAAYGGHDAIYLSLLGGVTAAVSVRGIRRRTQILASAGLVTAAFAMAAVTIGLRVGLPAAEVGSSIARGAANATLSAALVFLVLPIVESLARVTTDLTLLELSDPSRPLLARLAMEVPGTYAHTVAVANLSEAAATAIGANGLLARVGCYYHDIGKLHRPLHFSENQGPAGNPHDRLPPKTSAAIIRDHVEQGLALADEARLPAAIRDFIPEHHGTREIAYFLEKAKKRGPVSEEDLDLFRYPGPKPQSAETAIAMLADGIEAVVRVLEEPSAVRVRDAIDHVVRQRLEEGQLSEAPLTLGQLETVKAEFVRILSGMYHNRIEYPEEAGGITAHWGAASGS